MTAPLLELVERRQWWRKHGTSLRFDCPCCGYPTLGERDCFDICPICWWEDDNQDDGDADRIYGGPNGDYSLTEGRLNFEKYLCQYRETDPRIEDLLVDELIELKKQLIAGYEVFMSNNTWNEDEFQSMIRKIEKSYFKKRLP
jgi:hypothetical protein